LLDGVDILPGDIQELETDVIVFGVDVRLAIGTAGGEQDNFPLPLFFREFHLQADFGVDGKRGFADDHQTFGGDIDHFADVSTRFVFVDAEVVNQMTSFLSPLIIHGIPPFPQEWDNRAGVSIKPAPMKPVMETHVEDTTIPSLS
jgi:hypothetical protein